MCAIMNYKPILPARISNTKGKVPSFYLPGYCQCAGKQVWYANLEFLCNLSSTNLSFYFLIFGSSKGGVGRHVLF